MPNSPKSQGCKCDEKQSEIVLQTLIVPFIMNQSEKYTIRTLLIVNYANAKKEGHLHCNGGVV